MKYNDSLCCLEESTWKNLNNEEKEQALQAIENEMASRQNRAPCLVMRYDMGGQDNGFFLRGKYTNDDRIIHINSNQYGDDPDKMLEAVIHEGRHAYQYDAVEGRVNHDNKEEVKLWEDNLKGKYIGPKQNPEQYRNQPVEKDAFAFGREQAKKVKEEMRQNMENMRDEADSISQSQINSYFDERFAYFNQKLNSMSKQESSGNIESQCTGREASSLQSSQTGFCNGENAAEEDQSQGIGR
ncbi:hypothetical protein DFR58_1592 [Anaerobacterium chartisolvens]|uniref:SprT-like family protein n=1 Tax=Anaerobacterium chartisolvens TaxID=1297424 RepID=A0A369AFJ3_9FIRM|nr:hypothetical protein [Anaerobacterium chartisolvens]RCX07128.1 hypothetical protein DFR58_1592 [Anaerobacterium chartisolvens]